MNESYTPTPSDDITSTETPILVTDKLKDSIITESSVSTTINGEISNTPPIIKQKLPKLAITAGKPLKYDFCNKNIVQTIIEIIMLYYQIFDSQQRIL